MHRLDLLFRASGLSSAIVLSCVLTECRKLQRVSRRHQLRAQTRDCNQDRRTSVVRIAEHNPQRESASTETLARRNSDSEAYRSRQSLADSPVGLASTVPPRARFEEQHH